MDKFSATIEYIKGRKAIITLTNSNGEWSGSGLVQARSKADLYEIGYTHASVSATGKGGVLDRYQVIK